MILNIQHHQSSHLAIIDSNGVSIRYGELCDAAIKIKNLKLPRSLAFVLCSNSVGAVVWSMSLINSGVVPLFINSNLDTALLDSLIETYKPRFICKPSSATINNNLISKLIASYYDYEFVETTFPIYKINTELSYLLPTSGSTGSPKLVRHSYTNIDAAAENIATFFNIKSDDRPLVVLPMYYTMGLSMVFSHLYAGSTLLMTDQSMASGEFWKFIKDEKATSFTGVPYSFEALKMLRFMRMDLPHLNLLTQGGGKLSETLNREFVDYCEKTGKRWIATYGQTEGSARMAYLPAEFASTKLGSIGKTVPNGELFLIDAEGVVITSPNVKGELCYKGRNVTMGYAQSVNDLLLGDERNGCLHTGDIAYFDEDGFFYIVGRKSRFLKLYGMRIALDECESIIKTHYQIECACTGSDKKLIIYIINELLKNDVKSIIIEKTNLIASAIEVRIINNIPKNEAGKTLYSKLTNL